MSGARSHASPSELRANWRALFACFVGMVFAIGTVATYTAGVFGLAIAQDFGWSRVDLAWPMMLLYYTLVPGSLICGWLIDRYGPRRVILVSIMLFAAVLAIVSRLPPSRTLFAALFVTLALTGIGTLPVSYARVIVDRFERQRGLALGIALTGVGVGAAVLPIVVQRLIEVSDWRAAYLALALGVAGIALPVAWAFIHDVDADAASARPALDLRAVFGSRRPIIALLTGISFLSGAVLTGLIVHLVPILRDRGFDTGGAARIAGLMGASVIVGRVTIGLLMDRMQAARVLAVFLAGPALGALLLSAGTDTTVAPVAAVLIGLAQGAEVDAIAFLVSRHFDRRHFGLLYGTMFAAFTVGAANGPLVIAWTSLDGYGPALVATSAVAGLAALMAALLPSYRR